MIDRITILGIVDMLASCVDFSFVITRDVVMLYYYTCKGRC